MKLNLFLSLKTTQNHPQSTSIPPPPSFRCRSNNESPFRQIKKPRICCTSIFIFTPSFISLILNRNPCFHMYIIQHDIHLSVHSNLFKDHGCLCWALSHDKTYNMKRNERSLWWEKFYKIFFNHPVIKNSKENDVKNSEEEKVENFFYFKKGTLKMDNVN